MKPIRLFLRISFPLLALLQDKLIPKARQSLEIARAGYLSGQIDFFNLLDAERTLLNFQLQDWKRARAAKSFWQICR